MVILDLPSTFLPVSKSHCDEIVAKTIASTAPPTPLPIFLKSAWFDSFSNDRFQPLSAQASTSSSPVFTLDCEVASSSYNIASSSYATLDTGTDAKSSMFTSASSYARLTAKGMSLGMCGLTMLTQSNEHNSDDDEMFWKPLTMMERWLEISE